MPGASFYGAAGEGCSWQGTTLDGADFRYAKLRGRSAQQSVTPQGEPPRVGLPRRTVRARVPRGSRLLQGGPHVGELQPGAAGGHQLLGREPLRREIPRRERQGEVQLRGGQPERAIWEQP